MSEFIRARSEEQKAQRLAEVKAVARKQFATRPYHEITLTTIADELGWSRANLYKYVSTKEEIFLLLASDACTEYFDALFAALPEGCGFSEATVTEVWAGIANAHQEYFRLGDLLSTIIETNVTVERLAAFKQGYYRNVDAMAKRLPRILNIKVSDVERLLLDGARKWLLGEPPHRASARADRTHAPRNRFPFRDARIHRHVPRTLHCLTPRHPNSVRHSPDG